MNNDEKKISAAEGKESAKASAASGAGFNLLDWWKKLATGIKAAIIAGLALVVIVPIILIVALSGDGSSSGGPGGIINGGGAGSIKKESYSVTVVTEGGMAMTKLPIYIYEYKDGSLGDLVDGGVAATDDSGKATFSLPKGGEYAAKIDVSIPDGYDVQPYYPLVSANFEIEISSAVIPESDLTGVSYKIGDVIRDFTVTTTEGKQFKLSEVLKEKDAVLLNFWYVNCSACQLEFPYMQSAYEDYTDDVAIIALNPYADDTAYDVSEFKSSYELTFDMAKEYSGIASAFGVNAYPTSVMVDRYGVITLIHVGAITAERPFTLMFDAFIGENYEQKLVYDVNDIVPREKPDVEMPDSDEISEVLDGGLIEDIEYSPYPADASDDEKEYSWPFVISEFKGDNVVKPSNSFKEGSYAQLIMNVPLMSGEALAFDYFSSTELRADNLYVIVDGKDIYSISGPYDSTVSDEVNAEAAANNDWSTCFAYVAEEDATYEIALVYQKDNSEDYGDDTVYIKNLRVCEIDEIDTPTYIYRFAATKPDRYGDYQEYAPIFYNENDGYYHVDSVDGPILLANLMGYTRFSSDDYVYNMGLGKDYEAALTKYCNYASNSTINGICPVTEELKELLIKVALDNFGDPNNADEWLEFCCYYDSYGTDEQLEDPIKGLATFSAYDVVLSAKGDTDFPNSVYYNRPIMPRGLFSKFTPTESGTYLITSYAPGVKEGTFIDCEAWIFKPDNFDTKEVWYTYLNVDKNNMGMTGDISNTYMMAYLEAGEDYYINIAYGDVYQEGTIYFRVERLGGEGVYRFSLASPSFHTFLENTQGELTETVSGGIPLELVDGYWREKRTDGRLGSILYVDFTGLTTIFQSKPIYSADPKVNDLIDGGAFNFTYSEEDLYVLNTLNKFGGDVEKCREALREELGDAYNAVYYDSYDDGTPYLVTGYAVDEVLAGQYHGAGGDKTDFVLSYVDKIIKAGDEISFVNDDGTGTTTMIVEEDSPMIGCVAVDAELAEVLQMLMDKYVFAGVKNSWAKLCYYHQFFNEVTPH
ncbi:MAG: redoxin domain-containing protein [Clostridia bacterium]|nr:redoxin domain-containing protein [Clostridia bacterium]